MLWKQCLIPMFARSIKFFKVKMLYFKDHMYFRMRICLWHVFIFLFFNIHCYWYSAFVSKLLNWIGWFWKFDWKFLFKIHQTPETFQFKVLNDNQCRPRRRKRIVRICVYVAKSNKGQKCERNRKVSLILLYQTMCET